jgi:hypothetical protein
MFSTGKLSIESSEHKTAGVSMVESLSPNPVWNELPDETKEAALFIASAFEAVRLEALAQQEEPPKHEWWLGTRMLSAVDPVDVQRFWGDIGLF